MRPEDYGVAPVWRSTGDGDYTIPAGYRCIGFYVGTTAGNVTVTSGASDVTIPAPLQSVLPCNVSAFKASSTTAVGIWAQLVKG
jgi:hypothetical protein